MSDPFSHNTEMLLLLSEPLLSGGGRGRLASSESAPSLLTPGECRKLFSLLDALDREPSDLPADGTLQQLQEADPTVDLDRLRCLLAREAALERASAVWQDQSIWVVSQFDDDYPLRFRERAGSKAPLVCYGIGDRALLSRGQSSPSLAVVGPRDIDPARAEAAGDVARLAAEAGVTIVSGGARGIDQAAMQGAVRHGGWSVGVLADRLARMSSQPEARGWIEDGQLTLISICDPLAGFSVGYAMQRNKLIYALADVALVIGANYQRGGTWAGAVEQLRNLHYASVYVWDDGEADVARDGLLEMGAKIWPRPHSSTALRSLISCISQELPKAGPAV